MINQDSVPSSEDTAVAKESSNILEGLSSAQSVRMVIEGANQVEISIPTYALPHIAQLLSGIAKGSTVRVIHDEKEMTTQEAADFLGVSRKFLIDELVEKGKLPVRMIGTRRKIPTADLIAYKEDNKAQRRKAIDAMVEHDQKMGLP
jgi:excisionase family DNA binding protein